MLNLFVLDLKNAFDTVDHQILIKKVFSYGIRGHTLKSLQNYQTDRSQYLSSMVFLMGKFLDRYCLLFI